MGERYEQNVSKTFSDNRWCWVVLSGIFFIYAFISIKIQLFSLLYFELFTSSHTSTTTIAWIFNAFQFMMDISIQFAGPLQERFGFRPVIFCCGLIMGLSSLASAAVTIPEILFVTYSLFSGTAAGLLFTMGHFILPLYFEKRLGFANGIMMSGISFGQVFAPILLSALKNAYGKYAPFFLGVMYFHICAAAVILVSPRIASRKRIRSMEEAFNICDGSGINSKNELHDADNFSHTCSGSEEISKEISLQDFQHPENVSPAKSSILKKVFANLKVLRYYKVLIIVLSISFLYISAMNFQMIIPFLLNNSKNSRELITWSYITFAICNFSSRIIIPSLSDKIMMSKKWYILIGSLGTGSSLISLTIASSTEIILVSIGIFGFSMGCTTSLQSLLIIEFMGIDLLPATFGANGLIMAISFLILGPIIGIIRDQSASYNVALLFISFLCFLSALLWTLMPLAIYLDNRKLTKQSTEDRKQSNKLT